MVLQKRLGYEFNGYRVPNVPRGSRSIRGKRCARKRFAQNEMCAFELLASVAGELLLQKESIPAQSDVREIRDERESPSKFYESDQKSLMGEIVIVSDPPEKESVFNRVKSEFPENGASEEQMEVELKPSQLLSSCSSVEMEKSSGCEQTPTKPFRSQRIVDRRLRKLLASKFWEFSDKEEDVKPLFYSRKMCHKRQRTQKFSFKRKKIFQRGSISSSDLPRRPEMHIKGEASSSDTGGHGGNGEMSSSTGAQKFAFDSNDYRVKLSIKSFKVPELFIEIPETATVGSLKRTVMEAVTAILGGGLRVGVHLEGKRVRDDSKTLVQAGICHGEELGSLGFTLEPNSLPSPKQHVPIDQVPVCDSPEPLKRLPPISISGGSPLGGGGDLAEVPSPAAVSNALVAVHAAETEALQMFPVNGKMRRSEASQRRVRRPFSVTEVEALVHAVEKLGTGRWRDVKLCAFDGSKHRTYVDLKDKWKTLVHTAKISPQRRRGEPVPQELLDRVLSAHAYWSEHQQPKPDPCPRILS